MFQTYQERVSPILQWLLLGGDFQEEKQKKKYQLGACLVAKNIFQHTVNEVNNWQNPKDSTSSKKKSKTSKEQTPEEPQIMITDTGTEHHPGIVDMDSIAAPPPLILLKADKAIQLHIIADHLVGLAMKGW